MTVLYLQPFHLVLSGWAYRTLFTAIIALQLLKLHQSYGLPVAWNLSSISMWARPLLTSSDAHYLLLALGARFSSPVTAALPSFFVVALYSVAFFLSEHYSRHPLWQTQGLKFYQLMIKYQQHALLFNAQNEVMLGFMMLAMMLMPQRQPILLLVVWNFLRMRYWSPDGSWYHKQVGHGKGLCSVPSTSVQRVVNQLLAWHQYEAVEVLLASSLRHDIVMDVMLHLNWIAVCSSQVTLMRDPQVI